MPVKEIAAPLYGAKMWLKLVGVLMIIYGAIAAITIVGIVFAWLPIWVGILLFQAARSLEEAYHAGDEVAMLTAMGKLKTYFTIMGVITLIGLAITLLSVLMGGMAGLMGL